LGYLIIREYFSWPGRKELGVMTRDKKRMPIENIPLNQGSQDLGPRTLG